LTSPTIVKVGRAVKADLRRLADKWNLNELHKQLNVKESAHIIELGKLAKAKGAVSDGRASLASLCGIILCHALCKTNDIRLSLWSTPILTPEQKEYAALDAYAALSIWEHLSVKPTVGLPVKMFTPGALVNVQVGKKIVAKGHIAIQSSHTKIKHIEGEKTIKISPSRVVIEVDEVNSPGYEPAVHKISLDQMGPPPFVLVIAKSMLRTRNEIPPVIPPCSDSDSLALPNDIGSYPPPSVLQPDNIDQIMQSHNEDTDSKSDDDDSDDEDEDGGTADEFDITELTQKNSELSTTPPIQDVPSTSQLPSSASSVPVSQQKQKSSLPSTAQLHGRNWEENLSEASRSFPSLTQPSGISWKGLLTRILQDIFHVEDRLLRLLPERHSAYKAFAIAFTQAIFVYDKDDRAAIEAALKKHNVTWEYALRTKKDAIHRRVRRYVPPPNILCQALKTLFDCWQNVPCSLDPEKGPLFNKNARKQAKNILQIAHLGLMSDPPGIALYYKMGVDKNGLSYYRSVRGTNSIEGGIHMPLRRTFGSLSASPELTDALLCNSRHRRNTTVGTFNRTGKKHMSHFDQWIRDDIVELAAEVGIKPSFPIPDVLATRVATTEKFGIIPVPKSIVERLGFTPSTPVTDSNIIPLHRGIPVNSLSQLSTRRVSAYRFLSECQQTTHAVVPVHTGGEFSLFKSMLNSGGFYKQESSLLLQMHQ